MEAKLRKLLHLLGGQTLFRRYDSKSHTFADTNRKKSRDNGQTIDNSRGSQNGDGVFGQDDRTS